MIDFQSVTKNFEGHTALKDVTFSISSGKIFGLLGPNGAGKTTLLRLLTRMLLPDTGRILFDKKLMSDTDLHQIGYLPEERGLYPKMFADEHIHFLSSLKGVKFRNSKERLSYWARELDIEELLRRKIENLSKGQQQKIQLIACLIHEPQLLILDEPFSGFDPINAELLKKILFDLKHKGKTILISTHRMDNAEELCDDISMLYHGSLVLNGSMNEILNSQIHKRHKVRTISQISGDSNFKILSYLDNESTIEIAEGIPLNTIISEIMLQSEIISIMPEKKTLREVFLEKAK
ncbi:MAG: ABC transporter ATP-binding protein [Opitutaceae bacterium]|nr:ABC transporter ATP-binding protein [Cytophagales bacterium]